MVKPGYRQTELGLIPDDWEVFQFGDHFNIFAGGDVPKHSLAAIQSERHPYPIFANAIQRQGLYGYTGEKRSDGNAVTVTARGFLGHAEYRESPFFPIVRLLVMEPVGGLDAKFSAFSINDRVEFAIESTGVPQLTAPQVRKYSLAAPQNIDEQKAIAEALSDVDGLIAGLEALIAKKRDLKTATMQQLLTGKIRLPGFGDGVGMKQTELGEIPEDWDVKPLREHLRIRHGKSQKDVVTDDGEFPILATGGVFGRASIPLYEKPSVLIGRKGTIDVPLFMDTPFWTVDTLFYSEVAVTSDPKFLFYKFGFIDWYQFNEASGVPSLSSGTIEAIQIAAPIEKEEQAAISSVLTDFDKEIECHGTRLTKAKAMKQGMMQELLTGRTRLN